MRKHSASEQRGDSIHVVPVQKVLTDCSKKYCSPREIMYCQSNKAEPGNLDNNQSSKLRSHTPKFNFKYNCLFCSQPVTNNKPHQCAHDGLIIFKVRTETFKYTILQICQERSDVGPASEK